MSKIKNATIAAVCALGAFAATTTPASAVGTATGTYDCVNNQGSGISATFTRTAPTTPATKNLTLIVSIDYGITTPLGVGAVTATLSDPSSTPPVILTNTNVVPATATRSRIDIKFSGPSPSTLNGPLPLTLVFASAWTVTCTGTSGIGWPI